MKEKNNRNLLIIIIVLLAILIILLGVALTIFVFKSNDKKEVVTQILTTQEVTTEEPTTEEPTAAPIDYSFYVGDWESEYGGDLSITKCSKNLIKFTYDTVYARGQIASISCIAEGKNNAYKFTFDEDEQFNTGKGTIVIKNKNKIVMDIKITGKNENYTGVENGYGIPEGKRTFTRK